MGVLGCCGKLALCIVNAIVFVLGLVIVVISSIIVNDGSYFGVVRTDNTFTLPIAALIIGLLIICVSFLGFFGACMEHTSMLRVYSGLLLLLFIGEMTVAIMILINASIPTEDIQNQMDETFKQYQNDTSDLHDDLDTLQYVFECCGVRNYSDWATYPYGEDHPDSIPDGCCRPDYSYEGCGDKVLLKQDFEKYIYTDGCCYVWEYTVGVLEIAMGVICLLFAVVQAVSFCCACGLAISIS